MPENNIEKNIDYERGKVNDPSRSPEENARASENINEMFQIKKTQEATEKQKNESAKEFRERMEKEIKESFFDIVKTGLDQKFLDVFAETLAKEVLRRFWTKRPSETFIQMTEWSRAHPNPKVREMCEKALNIIQDEEVKKRKNNAL